MKDIPFAKFQAVGNDFLVVGAKGLPRSLPKLARAMLDRHTGVGADGLLVLAPPRAKKKDASLRVFNADGSEAEMSGNGIRCAGAFLAGLYPSPRTFLIETLAGAKSLERVKGERGKLRFRVGMGAPVLDPVRIPFEALDFPAPVKGFPLHTEYGVLPVTVTSMGNPHCSVFVAPDFSPTGWVAARQTNAARKEGATPHAAQGISPAAAVVGWELLGREIENNALFPNHTNVEFVRVISRKEIEVRFFERGVGHTLSSGTGSCAATVASILNGLTDREVRVQTEAGTLEVAWREAGEIILTGPVERIAQGTYNY
jgi:diaminopimelate epimerase